MGIDKLIFGVCTFFHVGNATEHFALKEHALSVAKIETMRSEVMIRIISDAQGTLLKVDFGTGRAGLNSPRRP
jgi:hypothetical protein